MNNISLSKEAIEMIISNKYMDAINFDWKDHDVSFSFSEIKDDEYTATNQNLKHVIHGLENTLIEMQGRLMQSERDHQLTLKEMING